MSLNFIKDVTNASRVKHTGTRLGSPSLMKVTCVTYIPRACLLLRQENGIVTCPGKLPPKILSTYGKSKADAAQFPACSLLTIKTEVVRKSTTPPIDRINGEEGYTFHNIQLVCYRINIMKHTLSEDMFYWWVKTINDFSCD